MTITLNIGVIMNTNEDNKLLLSEGLYLTQLLRRQAPERVLYCFNKYVLGKYNFYIIVKDFITVLNNHQEHSCLEWIKQNTVSLEEPITLLDLTSADGIRKYIVELLKLNFDIGLMFNTSEPNNEINKVFSNYDNKFSETLNEIINLLKDKDLLKFVKLYSRDWFEVNPYGGTIPDINKIMNGVFKSHTASEYMITIKSVEELTDILFGKNPYGTSAVEVLKQLEK